MDVLRSASAWILVINGLLFGAFLAWNHLRVRGARRRLGIPEETASIRDARSMHGLVLEGLSFLVAAAFFRSSREAADWRHVASVGAGLLAVVLLWTALRHLGMEWRIKAVVTQDHRLITTGPYAWMRHPVFSALFCLLLAQVLLVTAPVAGVCALAICIWGTEIRIRAEDGLLRRQFGTQFEQYSGRVRALIPLRVRR